MGLKVGLEDLGLQVAGGVKGGVVGGVLVGETGGVVGGVGGSGGLGTKRAEQFRLCSALFRLFCHVWFCSAMFRLCSALFCRVPPFRKNGSL